MVEEHLGHHARQAVRGPQQGEPQGIQQPKHNVPKGGGDARVVVGEGPWLVAHQDGERLDIGGQVVFPDEAEDGEGPVRGRQVLDVDAEEGEPAVDAPDYVAKQHGEREGAPLLADQRDVLERVAAAGPRALLGGEHVGMGLIPHFGLGGRRAMAAAEDVDQQLGREVVNGELARGVHVGNSRVVQGGPGRSRAVQGGFVVNGKDGKRCARREERDRQTDLLSFFAPLPLLEFGTAGSSLASICQKGRKVFISLRSVFFFFFFFFPGNRAVLVEYLLQVFDALRFVSAETMQGSW